MSLIVAFLMGGRGESVRELRYARTVNVLKARALIAEIAEG